MKFYQFDGKHFSFHIFAYAFKSQESLPLKFAKQSYFIWEYQSTMFRTIYLNLLVFTCSKNV